MERTRKRWLDFSLTGGEEPGLEGIGDGMSFDDEDSVDDDDSDGEEVATAAGGGEAAFDSWRRCLTVWIG